MIAERVQALALGGMIQITKGKQRTSEMPTLKKLISTHRKLSLTINFQYENIKKLTKTQSKSPISLKFKILSILSVTKFTCYSKSKTLKLP